MKNACVSGMMGRYVNSLGTAARRTIRALLLGVGAALVLAPLLSLGQSVTGDGPSVEKGFQKIFNGKDLTGWQGHPKLWFVKDGAITGQTTAENPAKRNTFLIWTNGTVGDFELRCQFKISPNNSQGFANSGIQYRSKVLDPSYWVVGGYQADMEAGPNYTGTLYEEGSPRGTMAMRGEKVLWDKDCKKEVTGELGKADELLALIKAGQWNEYVIIAKGNHLEQFINGKQMIDIIDDCEASRAMSGVLALQLHAGPSMTVQFKDLRLRDFGGSASGGAGELEKLQGTWRAMAGEAEGSPWPQEATTNIVVSIKGNAYTVTSPDFTDHGEFSVDPSHQPKQMDVRPATGDDKGRTIAAIYELEGDRLRICYAHGESPRPTAFTAPADSGRILLTYTRQK